MPEGIGSVTETIAVGKHNGDFIMDLVRIRTQAIHSRRAKASFFEEALEK